jgi:hypothetical protein
MSMKKPTKLKLGQSQIMSKTSPNFRKVKYPNEGQASSNKFRKAI